MALTLRPYQQRCEDAVFGGWDGGLDRVAISVATGGGKTPTLVSIGQRHLASYREEGPVVLLAHRRELIKQAAKHFQSFGPELKVEVVLGNPGREGSTRRAKTLTNWRNADVLVSTVQTLGSAATLKDFPNPSLVIVDEAHRSPANQYKKVLNALGCFSGTRTLGVTATPFREDHREFGDVFEAIVASVDIGWLITHNHTADGTEVEVAPGEGYLIPPTLRHLLVDGLDLSTIPTSKLNGSVDFRDAELAAEMERSGAFEMVTQTVRKELSDRKGVIFAPTVASSIHLAETMTAAGLPCHHIDGTMTTPLRDKLLKDFRSGTVTWISNVNIVTEGFDVPDIDAVVLARPTTSRIFFRQAVGRCLRPSPGKVDAIVLDVAGASDGMSLAGVEALTDTDTVSARTGESLTELLSRTDRERRGRYNRIQTHASKAMDVQNRAERALEQIRKTAEEMKDKLPGLEVFTENAGPKHLKVLDHTTAAMNRFHETKPSMTIAELEQAETFISGEAHSASKALGEVDGVKVIMRHALATLKDEPTSEIAQAMITGEVRTVRGNLFGEEAERYRPGEPGDVQGLKARNTAKDTKPVHDSRFGWSLRSNDGHLFVPVHGNGEKEPVALVVAIRNGIDYTPVWWDLKSGDTDDFATDMSLDDAYQLIVERALEATTAENLINPNAAWRKKPASDKARAFATRIAPQTEIPDNATAGFTGDVVSHGKYNKKVDALGKWVVEQKGVAQHAVAVVA